MSHIQEQHAADLKVEARLLKLTEQKPEDLATMRYERGLEYLTDVLALPPDMLELVQRSPLFWHWWVNAWRRRDAALSFRLKVQPDGSARIHGIGESGFLNQTGIEVRDSEHLRTIWQSYHAPAELLYVTPDAGHLKRWCLDGQTRQEDEKPALRAA
jgi:hypothetical protein